MTTVKQYYGISGDVPFLDVNVYVDNRLFVDAFAIRMGLGPAKFVKAANFCTETFFDEVTQCVVSANLQRRERGLKRLQKFEEPRETRLGMSKSGCNGHGGADGVGEDIWEILTGNAAALVQVGVLKHIEELPLFVPGIGNDITSDLTTRVIFEPLADFTREMVSVFPELSGKEGVQPFVRQVWDPIAVAWIDQTIELPAVDGKPLLLVPKEWARHELTLNATRFYDTSLLSHIQMKRAVRLKDGKLVKTPKDRLREDAALRRGYDTILRIVEEAYGSNRSNLVVDFKRWAHERYRPTTEDQIARRTA